MNSSYRRREVPNAELWFDIGRAHEQLGEYGLAIENYQPLSARSRGCTGRR